MNETRIIANPDLPTVEIIREFDAPRERVFRAWTDPELFVQWIGPNSVTNKVDHWDCRTGGSYRYVCIDDGVEHGFFGSFHEIRPDRLVQTFCYEGWPDGVALEFLYFEELPGDRTRLRTVSVVDTIEGRDAFVSSGMDVGVNEGYLKLDKLLAAQS